MSILDRSSEPGAREPAFFSLQIAEARRFFAPTDRSARRMPVRVVGGGVERCAADYRIERTGFPYVGVEFVARGKGHVRLGSARHTLGPGMLFAYDRSVDHVITSDRDDPLVKYFVDGTGPGVRRLLRDAGLPPGGVTHSVSPQSILPIFDELIRSGLERSGPRAARCCAALFDALMCRIGDTRIGERRASKSKPGTRDGAGSPAFDTYLRCRREMHRSATHVRTLRELAERCGASEAYLCRLFARFGAGDTPYRLLRRLKLERAAARLATEPGLLVKQAAIDAGFTDAFTFSKAFRATFGRSPSQVRTRSA